MILILTFQEVTRIKEQLQRFSKMNNLEESISDPTQEVVWAWLTEYIAAGLNYIQ